jgi:hypothetical protein
MQARVLVMRGSKRGGVMGYRYDCSYPFLDVALRYDIPYEKVLEVLGLDGTQHVARFDGGNRGWDWTMIEEILRGTALADALDLAPAPKVPSYAKLRGRKAELARALLTGPSARDRNAG